ncbi:hypothetical protein MYE70_01845 [Marinobacter alexandrii]|uniref:hypothetical protein n=1 Tax=Marinobacter alexandrii TaxID=2570351 RepID=UPI001FFF3507|nr:hypothetical protein [Marinobacter alexandrii]MCK2147802.1 hypothetical protein [Marinobacter alexandrii]
MPGKVLVLLTTVATCVVATGYFLSADNTATFRWLSGGFSETSSDIRPQITASQPTVTSRLGPQPPGDSALGFMLASVADQYSQNTRYPPWSTPLTQAQANGYRGNHFDPVTLPLGNSGQFTVTLEKYRFTQGEPILIGASVTGPQVVSDNLTATLEKTPTRDSVATTTLAMSDDAGFYQGSLDGDEEPAEYRLIVEANIDGKPVRNVSTLTIEPHLGDFEGLSDTYLTNNNLVIPVRFSAVQSGHYALSAQLYAGRRPIALLQAEQRLTTGSDTIDLKAHGTVLAGLKLQGTLTLSHLQIRKLPEKPGSRTHYGFGPEQGFSFSPPDLDRLRDTPASDPESEQRAALLQQLADKF